MGHYARVTSPNYMLNTVTSLLDYGFETASVTRYLSDFYVVNASFLRMDNLSLGYRLKDVFNTKTDVRLSGTVQNVFVVSKYNGIDPEISNGIDNNIYPRPRTFLFGVTVDF
jgi:iron complex outermembrane receptor protein